MKMDIDLSMRGDILVVDDVPENLQLLFEILSSQGHDVRRVLNGVQALKVIEIDPPQLILLDIKMPIMDGYEVCRRLKASDRTKDIPVIFLSALNDVLDKVKAFSSGAVDYINKPFDVQEVLVRVEHQLKLQVITRELEKKNQQLASINRDLEAFSYMVSHDLRRPLTKIVGYGELLKGLIATLPMSGSSQQEAEEYLGLIMKSGGEMNQMITDLMHLAQIQQEPLHWSEVDLSALVTDLADRLQQQDLRRSVDWLITPGLWERGDRDLLKLALENLLDNAWKYSRMRDPARIEFGMLPDHIYFIRDNGAGFAMDENTPIFQPFQRFHEASEFHGTGVGLTIVQKVFHAHGGEIWCQSVPDQGTTFYFRWQPVSPE